MSLSEEVSSSQADPHDESSDSELSILNSDDDSSDSDEVSTKGNEAEEEFSNSNEQEAQDFPNSNKPDDECSADADCFVAPDGSKIWVPKCDETIKPHTNQHFPTLEDAFLFYQSYGRHCGFDVRKSTERTGRRGNLLAKYIQCSCGGKPPKNISQPDEDFVESMSTRKSTSRRTDCKARIIMKPAGQRGFVVMSFIEEHNHSFASKQCQMWLKCNRSVSVQYQNFIIDCSRANIGATKAYTLVKEVTGSYEDVGATVTDFKNFSRDVKVRFGDHDASMLLAKFKLKKETSNNTFFYDYKVNRRGHLTGLFWTDAIGQANYEVFGDVVSFDPTFRTNKYNMVFVPFTGVDNHWKNVTFAAGLLAKEKCKHFTWLINAFKTAMGRVPYCVITDQCPAIKKALQINWPGAKHRLCMWHIMNKLPAKIGPTLSSNKKFMAALKSVVYSDHLKPSEFEERWKAVMSEYKLESNVWLTGMFKKRKQWIPAYFSRIEMAGLLRTTSRSESSNSFFQHFHEKNDTLVEFYSSFESAMAKQRLNNSEDDKKSKETPKTATKTRIEMDAAKVYTLELYYKIREEIKSACYHISMPDCSRDDEKRNFTCQDELLNGKLFEVSVRHSDNHVKCSCNLYFRKGYLCSHAFAALKQCGIQTIPRHLVKPRWTKDAIKVHSTLGSSELPSNTDKVDRTKLKRTRAWFEFNNCLKNAGEDEDKVGTILTALQEINSKLQNDTDNNDSQPQAHRADKFVGPIPENEEGIQNPLISRNKGCGIRMQSSKEISMKSKKPRTCSTCGKNEGHNARTCPTSK